MHNLAAKAVGTPHRRRDALERIENWTLGGFVKFTDHCRERMAERCMNLIHILNVITRGALVATQWDAKHRNFKYLIQGRLSDDSSMTVVVAIDEPRHMLWFITVFKETPEAGPQGPAFFAFNFKSKRMGSACDFGDEFSKKIVEAFCGLARGGRGSVVFA